MTQLRKRLLIMAMITPLLCVADYYGTIELNLKFSPQARNLLAIEKHIKKIAPQWNGFRTKHVGFDHVQLIAYTGGDGMFGAGGYVATADQLSELRKFMERTSPPRPIYTDLVNVLAPELFLPQSKGSTNIGATLDSPHAVTR